MTDTDTSEYDEDDVPDADHIEERHDYPDPAFDEGADESVEAPVEDEGEAEDLPPEDPAQLEADEQIDPEEPDVALPPEPDEPPAEEGDDRNVADGPAH